MSIDGASTIGRMGSRVVGRRKESGPQRGSGTSESFVLPSTLTYVVQTTSIRV